MIVDAVRSPIGRKNGTLSHIRGDRLSAQIVNALVARNGVDPAEIEDVQWGCVTQVDEQAWNIRRDVTLTAGWPVSVAGTDGRSPVRLVDADELQCGRGSLVGAARPRRRGRRRGDSPGPDGLEQRLDVAARLGTPRHRDAGHLGRGDREAVEPAALRARPDLLRVASAGGSGDQARGASRRRSSRSSSTCRIRTTPASRRAHSRALRGRRGSATRPRLEKMATLQPASSPTRGDGRELVPDRRRLRRGARRLGGEGLRAIRSRATCALRLVRRRGSSTRTSCCTATRPRRRRRRSPRRG